MQSDYHYLSPQFDHLITIAKLYKIDLTDANTKEKNGNRFGAQPNDINLDIAGAIHTFVNEKKHGISDNALRNFVISQLVNWDYETEEIAKSILKVEALEN